MSIPRYPRLCTNILITHASTNSGRSTAALMELKLPSRVSARPHNTFVDRNRLSLRLRNQSLSLLFAFHIHCVVMSILAPSIAGFYSILIFSYGI